MFMQQTLSRAIDDSTLSTWVLLRGELGCLSVTSTINLSKMDRFAGESDLTFVSSQ